MKRGATDSLSLAEARRIAIAAQGADQGAERYEASASHVRRMVERLGVLQIDSVNVVARAHTLPVFARLGAYNVADLDRLAYGGRRRALFEYWGHAASLMPVAMQPLLRWRMEEAQRGKGVYSGLVRFAEAKAALIEDIVREIEARGPSAVGDFEAHANRKSGWWGWSDAKSALEWLFWTGRLTTATRRATFERVYDIPERVLPAAVLAAPTPAPADAKRALMAHAAQAFGVATEACLKDYYRLDGQAARQALAELVEEGTVLPVAVEGWTATAFLHKDARRPRRVAARTLLSPFDPLVWNRSRAEQLLGAHIRIELYTPKEKRKHGYYVLPFMYGDCIVGRVDVKADRDKGVLQALSVHAEPGFIPETFAAALADELRLMARWLGLSAVNAAPRGDAAEALRRAL